MTTNNIYAEGVKNVLETVKSEYFRISNDTTISDNTKHTKAYNLRKEIKRLVVIKSLLAVLTEEQVTAMTKKDKVFAEAISSIINPSDGGAKIVVKEGDTLLGIITSNPGAKDVVNRAMKAADKVGLKLGKDNNTFVKK